MLHGACRMFTSSTKAHYSRTGSTGWRRMLHVACCMSNVAYSCYMPHVVATCWPGSLYSYLDPLKICRSCPLCMLVACCMSHVACLHVRMSHVRMFACRMFACRMSHVCMSTCDMQHAMCNLRHATCSAYTVDSCLVGP